MLEVMFCLIQTCLEAIHLRKSEGTGKKLFKYSQISYCFCEGRVTLAATCVGKCLWASLRDGNLLMTLFKPFSFVHAIV